MIEFKRNASKILPYNIEQYIEFLNDDVPPTVKWYGVSFQLPDVFEGKDIGLKKFVEAYDGWFEYLISMFENDSSWIVNHDYKDMNWFPNNENNLISLRALFKERGIPNSFRGAVIFTKDDLLKFSKDLISYPYAVFNEDGFLYKDLDISNSELPLIIKISGHLNIDLLSTDRKILRKIVDENASDAFIIREYRGTSLEV